MKKLLLIASLAAIPILGNAQVFQENFDGNGPGFSAWTLIDGDGLNHAAAAADFDAGAWIRKDRGGPTPNYGGPDNNFAAMSSSWYDPAGTSNDWLISPAITLPAQNTLVQWDAKAQDADYPDGYKVMLAPNGGNTIADFTVTLYSTGGEQPNWTTRQAALAAYANTTVRIAFVNNSTDKFVLLIDNIIVKDAPTEAPLCPTLTAPANNTAGINYNAPLTLSWTAATTGVAAASYDVYLGTTPEATTLLGNVSGTSTTVTNLQPSTTYYWRVVAKNTAGESIGCTIYSFTTAANPFAPYCGPIAITSTTEPITMVNFAGINNTSSAATAGAPGHENYTGISGSVAPGNTYTITLKGNTNGNYTNRFVVFIDWNQNGILDDAGEVYAVTETLLNSTGTDAKQVAHQIAVPADALAGETRMRVKKIFGATNYLNPCLGASFGQLEDYTINVSTLGVTDAAKSTIKLYPNPVVDILNIEAAEKVKSISVYDVTGKLVTTEQLNAVKSQVNLSKLAAGVYVVNIETEKGVQSIKVLKK